MEINNNKEVPFEPFKLDTLATPSIPIYFFENDSNDLEDLRDAVKDAIDYLSPQDIFIIEAIYYEQVTYEVLGERLGVSNVHAWRLTKTAIKNLQERLLSNEYVTDYLNLGGADEE
jgi:RNA polymerase sigma factor (sigma-70 family)